MSLGRLKARLNEERFELLANVFVAVLRPVDLPTVNLTRPPSARNETNHVKLVDSRHNLGDSEAAHEHDVLARLPTAIETRLELTSRSVYYKKRAVCLRSTGDHVWDEVPVSGSIKYGDIPVSCRDRLHGNVHRYTPCLQNQPPPFAYIRTRRQYLRLPLALLSGTVKLPRPAEAPFANLTARPFIRHFCFFVDAACVIEQSSHERRLSSIDVAFGEFKCP